MKIPKFLRICDLEWDKLENNLDAKTSEEFINQFRNIFLSHKARNAKGVIYVWLSEKPIPRLQGESNVVYIGQTKQSLKERHSRWAKIEGNSYNWSRYKHIINEFGSISIYFAVIKEDRKNKETGILNLYYEQHLEYPPANRTSK